MFPSLEGTIGSLDNSSFISILDQTKGRCGFLNHHFISYGLKFHKKVVLIGIDQSFGHFHSVGLKLGYNLFKLKGEKRVEFLEGSKRILQSVIGSETIFRPETGLHELYKEICQLVTPDCFLVVDNLSVITNLGFSQRDLAVFLSKLRHKMAEVGGRLVTTFCTSSPDLVNTNFLRTSDMNFILQDLKTGKSKEVTGHLTIQRRTQHGEMDCSDYQYRVEEKIVKVFPPGTSGAVL